MNSREHSWKWMQNGKNLIYGTSCWLISLSQTSSPKYSLNFPVDSRSCSQEHSSPMYSWKLDSMLLTLYSQPFYTCVWDILILNPHGWWITLSLWKEGRFLSSEPSFFPSYPWVRDISLLAPHYPPFPPLGRGYLFVPHTTYP